MPICIKGGTQSSKGAEVRKNSKRERDNSSECESDEEDGPVRKGRKLHNQVKSSLKQSQLKVFRGINVPFTEEQEEVVRQQFLRATVSANLPFRWVEDPEIITLFLLFRSTVEHVMPSRKQIAGPLLDKADNDAMKRLKEVLRGEWAVVSADGWKDESRNSINGVNLSVGGKVRPLQTIDNVTKFQIVAPH
jgi:hypothetical protein